MEKTLRKQCEALSRALKLLLYIQIDKLNIDIKDKIIKDNLVLFTS